VKHTIEDLALFGGMPAFTAELHVGRPNIPQRGRLLQRINDVLDRRWLTNDGPLVEEFESAIARAVGVKHCTATCNGTTALQIAIRAVGLSGEVILPSFTFIATAHALEWQGLTPVFCDIESAGFGIDPEQIESLITKRTTGIIGVNLWGHPCDVRALEAVAARRGLKLIFDSAHAFGCSSHRRMIGNFGDAEVFSFHATKFLNTFEGGAVVTNDDEVARKLRLLRNYGFAAQDTVVQIGTNAKMNEVAAAMGLTSLEDMNNFVAVNRHNFYAYRQHLSGIAGVTLIEYDEAERNNYHYIVLEIDKSVTGISRDCLHALLAAEGVLVRRYFYPGCHRMAPYRFREPDVGARLLNTERTTARTLCLPTGTAVTLSDITTVCDVVQFAVAHGQDIATRMAASCSAETLA
jgi:dTDP-4-amino-4,6-dideoxygalactose transaminase